MKTSLSPVAVSRLLLVLCDVSPVADFAVVSRCQTIGLPPILCKHCLFLDLLCTSLAKTLLAILPGNVCAGAHKIPDKRTVEYGKIMVLKTNEDNVSSTTFSIPQFSDEM